jgi:hypothetical protein
MVNIEELKTTVESFFSSLENQLLRMLKERKQDIQKDIIQAFTYYTQTSSEFRKLDQENRKLLEKQSIQALGSALQGKIPSIIENITKDLNLMTAGICNLYYKGRNSKNCLDVFTPAHIQCISILNEKAQKNFFSSSWKITSRS